MKTPGRVLLVDDDSRISEVLSEFIGRSGHTVRTALTARAALAEAETFNPDVVLLDLTLPDMAGDTVFTRLRELYPQLPIIVMTGDSTRAHGIVQRGAAGLLAKPFNMRAAVDFIDTVLRTPDP